MHRPTLVALVCAILLAGCATPAEPSGSAAPQDAAAPATMTIVGLVQDSTFAPLAGASVSLRFTEHVATTDAGGVFRFDGLAPSAYLVDVQAEGFVNASLTAEPGTNASLNFILESAQPLGPLAVTTQFHGFWECALEIVIISPSCDSALTFAGAPAQFNDTSRFEQGVNANWKTLVVDVDFDPSANPGLDGLRLVVRGRNDADQVNQYEQYGRFTGQDDFTARLEPGGSYDDGVGPVPVNATVFELQVYPQSLLWHPGGVGLLGAGAGMNVAFEVYVTAFYNEPAPDGWSFFTSAPA